MKIFSNLREFFWPLLERMGLAEQSDLEPNKIIVHSDKLDKALDLMFKMYESEEDRKKNVESKSSIFIGTISVVTTVAIGVTTVLVKESDFKFSLCILVFLLFLFTIYMARAVWFSIKALERRNYYSLSENDFLGSEEGDEYTKKLISVIANKTKRNSITINSKVDNMVMAQEYFKRAIVVVVVYAFVLLFYYFSKLNFGLSSYANKIIQGLNTINFNGWNALTLYFFTIIALILSIRVTLKKQ